MKLSPGVIYVISLEAENIKYAQEKGDGYTTKDKSFLSLYTGSLPYSLDLIELHRIAATEFKNHDGKQFTKALVDVKFNRVYRDKSANDKENHQISKTVTKKKELRQEFYRNGFNIDGEKYVLYKRSSSKSRVGSCLFIKEKYYDSMILWSRMNMDFQPNELVALASLKAYESLTLSGIEDTVKIKPQEILLVKDINGKFTHKASVTEFIDGKIVVEEKELPNDNIIFDGQALADTSLFPIDKDGKQKGMMLLRNRFFKACAFHTNLQRYFQDRDVTEVTDMFGRKKQASQVKLIITPSSLKLFKFAGKICGVETNIEPSEAQRKQCYDYWCRHVAYKFGVCKSEKPSKFAKYQQLTYQIINSMPLTDGDIAELLKEEIRYIDLLKNDIDVFRYHIHNDALNSSRDFIYNLLAVNDRVKDTQLYKDYRNEVLSDYLSRLRCGKIKIADTDYAVLCGNPYEMLKHAAGLKIEPTLHHGKEVYCSRFSDGQLLAGFRNPHICAGNVLYAKNVYKEELTRYFNFTDNIVVINSYDNDLFDRLQGADLDSDTVLLSSHPVLLKRAQECIDMLTPVNQIKFSEMSRPYHVDEMSKIDNVISDNLIGQIVNWSQILNSYYWDEYNGDREEDKLQLIYAKISELSSLSQVEIDKAKKYFDKQRLNIRARIAGIERLEYRGERIIRKATIQVKGVEKKRPVRPEFLFYCGKGKEYNFEYFGTPMDFLIAQLQKIRRVEKTTSIPVKEILSKDRIPANGKQIKVIKSIVKTADQKRKSIFANPYRDEEEDYDKISQIKEEAAEQLRKKKLTTGTVQTILKRIYVNDWNFDQEMYGYRTLLFGLLYSAHPQIVERCFNHISDGGITTLIKDENGEIEIWGEKYKKIQTKIG